MTTITIEGLMSPGGNETRAIAILKVIHDDNEYNWQSYVPENTSLDVFMQNITPIVLGQIAEKEQIWQNLDPKTKEVTHPITGEVIVVPIEKNEIVKPDIPDYYASRRNEYPSLSEQIAAIYKGPGSPDFIAMQNKIQAVKNKYPKSYILPEQQNLFQADLMQDVIQKTQIRLDTFAQTRNYSGILSACTYVSSDNPKFKAEADYCVESRTLTWQVLYSILAQVQAGLRPMPSGYAEIESELPVLTWPV